MTTTDRWKCMKFWYFVHGQDYPELSAYWKPISTKAIERVQIWKATQNFQYWVYVQIPVFSNVSFQVKKIFFFYYVLLLQYTYYMRYT